MSGPEGTPNGVDRLARIETWVYNGNFAASDDVLALVEIAKAAQALMENMAPADANHTWPGENELRCALKGLDSGATEERA